MARVLLLLLPLLVVAIAAADQCQDVGAKFDACDVSSICASCIATSGCFFSLVDLRCELTASATSATTYCSASDSLCAVCTVSAAQPTCAGADGCICPSVCSVVSSSSLESCSSGGGSSSRVLLGFIFMGCAVPAFMFAQVRLTETFMSRGRMLTDRERPGPPLPPRRRPRDSRLVPSLEAWRRHLEEHKDSLQDVELAACCYVEMETDGGQPESEAEAESPVSSSNGSTEAETYEEQDGRRLSGGGRSDPSEAAYPPPTAQRAAMWIM